MQSVPNRPIWFISRGNGEATPLIPADELPATVPIGTLPRAIPLHRTGGMVNLGHYPWTGIVNYRSLSDVDPNNEDISHQAGSMRSSRNPSNLFSHANAAFPMRASPNLVSIPVMRHSDVGGINMVEHQTQRPKRTEQRHRAEDEGHFKSQHREQEKLPAVAGTSKTPRLPPSGKEPDQSRKVYCTHWIRYGECDYMQQGCLYKHEMPADINTLRNIGFQKYPQWWTNKPSQLQKKCQSASKRVSTECPPPNELLAPIGSERHTQQNLPSRKAQTNRASAQAPRTSVGPRADIVTTSGGLTTSIHAPQTHEKARNPTQQQNLDEAHGEEALIDFNPLIPDHLPTSTAGSSASKSPTHIHSNDTQDEQQRAGKSPADPIFTRRFVKTARDTHTSDSATDDELDEPNFLFGIAGGPSSHANPRAILYRCGTGDAVVPQAYRPATNERSETDVDGNASASAAKNSKRRSRRTGRATSD